jgi:mRNA interferase RelE/StbE
MTKLIILPPAARYLKKIKDKPLKDKFRAAMDQIQIEPYCGDPKTGDLAGIYCYDFFYNKTKYEIAYTINKGD